MYVLEYRAYLRVPGRTMTTGHLWEMTAGEFKAAQKNDTDAHWHERISADLAHNIVRNDRFPHSTNLWVDGNRIRRA